MNCSISPVNRATAVVWAVLFLFLSFGTALQAQPPAINPNEKPSDYGIRSKKALKLFQEGKLSQQYHEYPKALSLFQEAIALEPNFAEANKRAGAMAFKLGHINEAIPYLRKGIELEPNKPSDAYYWLGLAYISMEKYADAIAPLQRFVNFERQFPPFVADARHQLQLAEFASEAINHPIEFKPENAGPNINSLHQEYMANLTADGQIMFFVSRRPECTGGYNHQLSDFAEDFWYSQLQPDSSWSAAVNLGPPVNTDENEGAASISPDGRFVFFTGCGLANSIGNCDIYVAEFDGTRWGSPRNLGPAVNSPFWESYPSISPDGKTLYFVSGRPGGVGEADIWYSRYVNGEWTRAKNMGPVVNSKGREHSPFLHADGQTLYFSSEGHLGFGGFDLFKSTRINDTTWSKPVNLGYPLNSAAAEMSLFVTTDGTEGYLNSDRLGGLGGIDIYHFKLDPRIRPKPATFVRGIVIDSVTRQFVGNAQLDFIDLETGDTIRSLRSAKTTGKFLLSLPLGRDYAAFVDGGGAYLWHSQNFSLQEVANQHFYDLTIELSKLEANQIVRLDNIFFDFDRDLLKDESLTELNKLLAFLEKNPRMRIEIRGHTDDRGSDDYNLKLSQQRAEAVRNWLVTKGIEASRLEAKGFGETKPIAPNTTDEGRALNRRTEFRILSVR